MPRDDTSPTQSSAGTGNNTGARPSHSHSHSHAQSNAAPLKRGDACLYCRKRRIKCSAEKPTCNNCTKLKRECVYDVGKPVSRVKQLEDKVAELEDLLKAGPGGVLVNNLSNGNGADNGGKDAHRPPPLQHHSSSGMSGGSNDAPQSNNGGSSRSYSLADQGGANANGGNEGTFDNFVNNITNFGMDTTLFPGFGASVFHPTPAPPPPPTHSLPQTQQHQQQQQYDQNPFGAQIPLDGFSRVDHTAVEMFDFSTLDPSFMNLVNSFADTSTSTGSTGGNNQNHNQNISQGGMEIDPFGGGSTGLTPFLDPTNGNPFGAVPSHPSRGVSQGVSPMTNPASSTSGSGNSYIPVSIQPTPKGGNASLSGVSYHGYLTELEPSPRSRDQSSAQQTTVEDEQPVASGGYQPSAQGAQRMSGENAATEPDIRSTLPFPKDMSGGWQQWREDPKVPAELDDSMGLVGGWFDAADLPKVARDHLLDLFFAGMRMFGQEFHVPRFFASLSLPPAKRPHPCLLYTMYLMASRISSSIPIRSLEPHFYAIATTKLEESIAHHDRLFDAVRAATILAVYKYSLAKYHEGWMMTGQAVRLAISCGLHTIPSSIFKPSPLPEDHRADLIGLMRQRAFVLPPPADPIALGERIWAFWSIFTVDRCGAIATQWPAGIPDEVITTPFPRPLYEYELGLVNTDDDLSLTQLYEPTTRPPLPYYAESTYIQIRMRAMSILDRASKLNVLKPEPGWKDRLRESSSLSPPSTGSGSGLGSVLGYSPPGWTEDMFMTEQYLNMMDGSPSINNDSRRGSQNQNPQQGQGQGAGQGPGGTGAGQGWMRTAKIRTPKAYDEILAALRRIEEDFPPERRTNWDVWDGKVQDWHFGGKARRELFVLHFIVGCAWMFLFDVFSFNAPNDKAVAVARRLSFTVKQIMNDNMGGDLDVFIAMCWSFIVKILIREVKRLQALGDTTTAAPMEDEIEIIVQAMQIFGKRYNIANYQAQRTNQYRKSTVQDLKFMEADDELDEHNFQLPDHPKTYRDNGIDLSEKGAASVLIDML